MSARSPFAAESPEGCALSYRNLVDPPHEGAAIARRSCEELWRDFQPLADCNFLDRFPFDFHQRWFEMYLGASLLRAGLKVTAPKPGPDFQILFAGRRVYVEAVCATPGHPLHPDAVPEPSYRDANGNPVAVRVPHDQITLRLASVFRAKRDAFDRYRRKGLVAKDEACIIAINSREIPQAWADAKEFLYRAFYGVGNRYLVIDTSARRIAAAGREHRTILGRSDGAAEEVAPLLDPDRADVCGILGSSVDVWNVPSPLGDDFVLMPHANPHVAFPQGLLRRGVELTLDPSEENGCWRISEMDYGAPEPRGPETLTVEYEGVSLEGEWQIAGRELRVRIDGNGSAILFRNGSDPAAAAREIALEMLRAYGVRTRSRTGGP